MEEKLWEADFRDWMTNHELNVFENPQFEYFTIAVIAYIKNIILAKQYWQSQSIVKLGDGRIEIAGNIYVDERSKRVNSLQSQSAISDEEIKELAEKTFPNQFEWDYPKQLGFIKGFKAANSGMKWIKASERLPEEGEIVHIKKYYWKLSKPDKYIAEMRNGVLVDVGNLRPFDKNYTIEWLYEPPTNNK